ncbi:MFS transporter [Aminobacter sp. HY435]|uniref:MFS transporter n=1 Tax=Aminobacter sp. HY435 TaxID=2970917 RepID=UPI0022B9B2D6|nr:MFS transporter [Aminobacter sp. HY435]
MDIADTTNPKPAANHVFCPPEARKFVLFSAILASSMGFIDGSVVSLALPVIREDLGASLVDAQWISNSYMLFLSALVLLGGAAGDVFGVRNIFAAGIALFMVTSAACALAVDADMLILMRAAQGIGAALMVPGSLAIIAKSYPTATRGKAIGQWAAFSSLTTAMGPFIGGMVLSFGADWMWRLIFAINVPIGLVALSMLLSKVPRDRPSSKRRLDVMGAILATTGLGLMAWGLTALGLPAADNAVSPWAWIAIGAAIFIGFVLWEKVARSPMVKLELFASRAFTGANLYTLILFFAFNAILFFLPMTVISGWGAQEWEASLLFLPLSLFIAGLSSYSGRLSDAIGPRWPLTVGAAIVGMSYTGLALTMPLMMLWQVTFPILLLNGLGMAIVVSPVSAAVMRATPEEDTGLASGINNALARAAGLMAVASLGAVAGIVFAKVLGNAAPGAEFGAFNTQSLDAAAETLRVAATNSAFVAIAAISAAMCFLAAAVAWLTQPSWKKKD